MTLADEINAAAAEVGTSAEAARDRATAVIADLRAQLEQVRADLQTALDSDTAEDAVLENALAGLRSADGLIDSIEPADQPPAEQPIEPETPTEEQPPA